MQACGLERQIDTLQRMASSLIDRYWVPVSRVLRAISGNWANFEFPRNCILLVKYPILSFGVLRLLWSLESTYATGLEWNISIAAVCALGPSVDLPDLRPPWPLSLLYKKVYGYQDFRQTRLPRFFGERSPATHRPVLARNAKAEPSAALPSDLWKRSSETRVPFRKTWFSRHPSLLWFRTVAVVLRDYRQWLWSAINM